jgi:hypothetical protein
MVGNGFKEIGGQENLTTNSKFARLGAVTALRAATRCHEDSSCG